MNTNTNSYTIIYSTVLVILVAAALAFTATTLKSPIEKNIEIEKKLNILMSVGKALEIKGNKNAFIEQEYKTYIREAFLVNVKGERVDGDAFATSIEDEFKLPVDERRLPVFVCEDKGTKQYILPVRGPGLWGPLWGYVALNEDLNTIFGVTFDHAGETPGLGSQIATPEFQNQFKNKKLNEGNTFVSVKVIKQGSAPLTDHSVDGISGGTITSKALGKMLFESLSNYRGFFKTAARTDNSDNNQ